MFLRSSAYWLPHAAYTSSSACDIEEFVCASWGLAAGAFGLPLGVSAPILYQVGCTVTVSLASIMTQLA